MNLLCRFDTRIKQKEEKMSKCNPLEFQLERLWKLEKVVIITVVIGALGTVTERMETWIKKNDIG